MGEKVTGYAATGDTGIEPLLRKYNIEGVHQVVISLMPIGRDQIAYTPEVFAAWALIRIITTVPLTPGGVGVVELGLTGALVGFGGNHAAVVTAVLLYRVLTYIPPITIGGVCLLVWRRLDALTVQSSAQARDAAPLVGSTPAAGCPLDADRAP